MMTASEERRMDKRSACKIPIVVSPFNSKEFKDALLMDYCMGGISFKSSQAFVPGSAILIRITYGDFKESLENDLHQLPSISVGEVKWCRKHPDKVSKAYNVGIKYYYPAWVDDNAKSHRAGEKPMSGLLMAVSKH